MNEGAGPRRMGGAEWAMPGLLSLVWRRLRRIPKAA